MQATYALYNFYKLCTIWIQFKHYTSIPAIKIVKKVNISTQNVTFLLKSTWISQSKQNVWYRSKFFLLLCIGLSQRLMYALAIFCRLNEMLLASSSINTYEAFLRELSKFYFIKFNLSHVTDNSQAAIPTVFRIFMWDGGDIMGCCSVVCCSNTSS